LLSNNYFQNIRLERKEEHRTVVGQVLWIKTRFLNIVLTISDLKASVTTSVASEELIATVVAGQIESMMVHRRGTEMGVDWEGAPLAGLNHGATALSRAG